MLNFFILHGYLLVLILLSAVLIVTGLVVNRSFLKQVFYNLSAVFIALILYETYLWMRKPDKDKTYNTGTYARTGYFNQSDLLGYQPADSGTFTSKKFTSGGVPVYEVTYTFKNGKRFTPNSYEDSPDVAVFFGCSITFGEGVADTCTWPYYYNEASGNKYRVINYGFHGYGPHQMLAIAENRLADDLRNGNAGKVVAIYSFIPDHIRRCAGYSKWDKNGPRYEIVNGKLIREGTFASLQDPGTKSNLLVSAWKSSNTYLANFALESKKASQDDVRRTIEIIRKTRAILQNHGIPFRVVAWNQRKDPGRIEQKDLDYFYTILKQSGIPVLFVTDTVSRERFEKERDLYSIRNEVHPTPYFYKTVACYIFNHSNP